MRIPAASGLRGIQAANCSKIKIFPFFGTVCTVSFEPARAGLLAALQRDFAGRTRWPRAVRLNYNADNKAPLGLTLSSAGASLKNIDISKGNPQ
jgi:hypothetical protein